MAKHVVDHPLFVIEVAASFDQSLDGLRKGLLECHGIVLIEVNEEKQEVRVRGNIQPLELVTKTHEVMGGKAKLTYYNKDPARMPDLKIESNGKEKKQEEEEEEEEEEDHYKPYVFKEHKPVKTPTSMSGKEFFDYFRGGAGSKNHKRINVPMVDPFAAVYPDYSQSHAVDPFSAFPNYSHMVDPFAQLPNYYNNFNSSVPMSHSPYPPHFY